MDKFTSVVTKTRRIVSRYDAHPTQHEIDSHSYIDTKPTRSVSLHQFRPRDPSKEIQPGMKYTTTTGVERVEEFIKNSILTEVANDQFKFDKNKFMDQTRNLSLFEKRSYMSRELSKNLLPSLHQKTHFKGIQEISNKVQSTRETNIATRSLHTIRKPSSLGLTDEKSNPVIYEDPNPEFSNSNPKE